MLGMISRFFGWVFLFVAGAVLVRDGMAWRAGDGKFTGPESLGGLWFDVSPASLGIFRADVLHTMAWLWNYLLAPVLSLWAGPVFLILSLGLLWAARAGEYRRRRATHVAPTRRPS
jgi:hypothetical protein